MITWNLNFSDEYQNDFDSVRVIIVIIIVIFVYNMYMLYRYMHINSQCRVVVMFFQFPVCWLLGYNNIIIWWENARWPTLYKYIHIREYASYLPCWIICPTNAVIPWTVFLIIVGFTVLGRPVRLNYIISSTLLYSPTRPLPTLLRCD